MNTNTINSTLTDKLNMRHIIASYLKTMFHVLISNKLLNLFDIVLYPTNNVVACCVLFLCVYVLVCGCVFYLYASDKLHLKKDNHSHQRTIILYEVNN